MSNKTECPVCGSYSSTITAGIQNHGKCPICGTSESAILQLEELQQKKKYYISQKIQKETIEENESLKTELIIKRDKYDNLKQIVWEMFYGMQKITKELEDTYMNRLKDWDK